LGFLSLSGLAHKDGHTPYAPQGQGIVSPGFLTPGLEAPHRPAPEGRCQRNSVCRLTRPRTCNYHLAPSGLRDGVCLFGFVGLGPVGWIKRSGSTVSRTRHVGLLGFAPGSFALVWEPFRMGFCALARRSVGGR